MATPTYEIYALKYGGPYTRPASMVNWFQDIDKNIQINYYIFAIRGERETVVVDCRRSQRFAIGPPRGWLTRRSPCTPWRGLAAAPASMS